MAQPNLEARAPVAGSPVTAQTAAVGAASTAAIAIAENTPGGAVYEFTATTLCHVKFGDSGVGAATTADLVLGPWVTRRYVEPSVTHLRVIQSAAAGFLSWQRVR